MGTFFGHQFFNWWKELSFIGGNRIIWITDRQWWNSNCSAAQLINITEGVISWSTGGVQGQGNNRNRDNWSIITQSYLLSSQFTDSFRHNAHWENITNCANKWFLSKDMRKMQTSCEVWKHYSKILLAILSMFTNGKEEQCTIYNTFCPHFAHSAVVLSACWWQCWYNVW